MKVFTNGCFDILTPAHYNLLMYCRELAGIDGRVIVAIDEDDKVMIDKGIRRPVFNVHERAKALLDLKCMDRQLVDNIEFFHTNLILEHIVRKISPDFIVKGSDWKGRRIIGSEVAKVMFFDRQQPYSTTGTIESVLKKYQP